MITGDDKEVVANLLNEIFHLPIAWHDAPENGFHVVNRADLRELVRLLKELSPKLRDPRLLDVIWAISLNGSFAGRRRLAERLAPATISENNRKHLRAALSGRESPEQFELYQLIALILQDCEKYHEAHGVILQKDIGDEFDVFLRAEKSLLKQSGLDQAAVSTILSYVEDRKHQILSSISGHSKFYTGRYARSEESLRKTAERVAHMKGGELIKTRLMGLIHKKAVGLATIWANALPILLGESWDVAGVWSCLAGATVATIMPSDNRK